MLGKRSPQRGLYEADRLYLDFVGEQTFYGFLARERDKLFEDEDFAGLYCRDNGRDSVPPSLLATALLLQAHDRVSDGEAKRRADLDLSWKVALGIEIDQRPFAKSTLQMFRAQLILHDRVRAIFQRSLEYAQETGYLRGRKMKAVLDTSYILGRGAVQDTYNLLAEGIKKLIWALARRLERVKPQRWAEAHGLGRYFGSSLKGQAAIDWDDEASRQALLRGIVADAEGLLAIAGESLNHLPAGSQAEEQVREAAQLLVQLLGQDLERHDQGQPRLKRGVAEDRIVSVHDPEMRHGHKSASKRFEGHKLALAVEPESQLVTAVEVLPGNAPDRERALALVEQSERNTGIQVEETIGDCAYGDGATREQFEQAGRKLVAKVARHGNRDRFPKEAFTIDLEAMSCTCPAGQVTRTLVSAATWRDRDGRTCVQQAFRFDGATCASCALRPACVRAGAGKGRSVNLHPQERLLQQARALQSSPAFEAYRAQRQVAEHRLARMMQLGMRRARYFGRSKTLFQALLAATVANLTLIAGKMGRMGRQRSQEDLLGLLLSRFKVAVKWLWAHSSSIIPSWSSSSLPWQPPRPCFRPCL